jgi:hypothetical protein
MPLCQSHQSSGTGSSTCGLGFPNGLDLWRSSNVVYQEALSSLMSCVPRAPLDWHRPKHIEVIPGTHQNYAFPYDLPVGAHLDGRGRGHETCSEQKGIGARIPEMCKDHARFNLLAIKKLTVAFCKFRLDPVCKRSRIDMPERCSMRIAILAGCPSVSFTA